MGRGGETAVGRKTRRAADFDSLYNLSAPVLSRATGAGSSRNCDKPGRVYLDARRGQNFRNPTAQNRRDLGERGKLPLGAPSFSPYRSSVTVPFRRIPFSQLSFAARINC